MLLGIGDNCIDCYLAPVPMECVGGNVLNVTAQIALHGQPAAYAGIVGDDAHGGRIIAALERIGVDVSGVAVKPGPSGVTEIEIADGDYRIVSEEYGVAATLSIDARLHELLARRASLVHLSLTGEAARLADAVRAHGLPVSVDLGIAKGMADLAPLVPLLDRFRTVFVSMGSGHADEHVAQTLAAVAEHGPAEVIATRGQDGSSALADGILRHQPSLLEPGRLLDPLGAGDAFIAGFLFSRERPLEQRLVEASRWAAATCTHYGGWPGADA